MQQCYLVVMSSLMAFALTGLESWTTWILLAALALWGEFLFECFLTLRFGGCVVSLWTVEDSSSGIA